jgi:hypothetical protein
MVEENKVMITTLNKRLKLFAENHKRIKQTISLGGKDDGIKKLVEIVDAEEVSECATES